MYVTPPQRGSTPLPTAANNRVVAIEANFPGCLGLMSDGTVGWVHRGDSREPLPVPDDLRTVRAIAVGREHALALLANGSVEGWSERPDMGLVDIPAGLDDVIAIAAGEAHSLALRKSGEVVGWGWRNRPAWAPLDLTDAVQIAAGGEYNLAIRRDGSVTMWGTRYVPAGPRSGPDDGPWTQPARSEDSVWNYPLDAVAVVAGERLGLAVLSDGNVAVLFDKKRGYGQPWYLMPGLSEVRAVTVAHAHLIEYALAVREDGTVIDSRSPSDSGGRLRDVTAVASNRLTTNYALKRNGTVEWWA